MLGEICLHWTPELCAFQGPPAQACQRAVPELSVSEGPPPGGPSLSVTQRAEEGPLGNAPSRSCLYVSVCVWGRGVQMGRVDREHPSFQNTLTPY